MSSFYGNIKFNNQTPLIYDKIYTSRYQMEQECHSDGIFNGRYVLISYGDVRYTPYHKVEPMNDQVFNSLCQAGYKYYITDSQSLDGFKETTEYKAGQDYYIKTIKSIDDTSEFAKNKSIDEQQYNHDYHSTVWQKIWTSTQDSNDIEEKYIMVSHLNAETPRMTMIVDAPSDIMEFDKSNQVFYLVPTNQHALNIPGKISKEDFDKNREKLFIKSNEMFDGEYIFSKVTENAEWNIDTIYYIYKNNVYEKYPDSKPYTDGMISEELFNDLTFNRHISLYVKSQDNSEEEYIISTEWDILTKYYFMRYRETDGRPHFDPIMSTDLEYRFHVPRNWKWDNNLDFDYNFEGFNPKKVNDTNTKQNEIILTTKISGDEYPIHREDEPSAAKYGQKNINLYYEQVKNLDSRYQQLVKDYSVAEQENNQEAMLNLQVELEKVQDEIQKALQALRELQESNENLTILKTKQPDMKRFRFNLRMLGDAVSKMWDEVYPRVQKNDPDSERNMFIGNDRDPANEIDYPGTLAEAVRKLYYWLGIKSDNNFVQGPWIDPATGDKVDTIFGVLNGASDLLGSFGDTFKDELFIPVASPYYPDGYDHLKEDEGFTQLTLEEFELLHNGGAGPLYIQKEDGSYEQATEYDYNEQYYRNMNSLLALLRAWQDIVKDTQADWTYDVGHIEWDQNNPLHPRFIRNKPVVLTVDPTAEDESSINWYWKNYAL